MREEKYISFARGDAKESWGTAPEAEVHVFPTGGCRAYNEIVRIGALDVDKCRISLTGAECVAPIEAGDRYFIENVFDELDSPGEWYLDRNAGFLYYWPKKVPLTESQVIGAVLGRVLQFEGNEAKGDLLTNVRFAGLTFAGNDYSPEDGCVGIASGREGSIYLCGAVDFAVQDCHFICIGKAAVCLVGGRGNKITGNDVAYGAEGGIVLHSSAANEISDNHIHHCGAVYKHVAGVTLEGVKTSDNTVAHNLIHDVPRYGVQMLWAGMRNVVEYNEVFNANLETYDTAGIMAYQDDRKFRCGSVIRYNFVHDTVGYSSMMGCDMFDSHGIYIDGFSSGYTVNHNVLWRKFARRDICPRWAGQPRFQQRARGERRSAILEHEFPEELPRSGVHTEHPLLFVAKDRPNVGL